MYVLENYVCKPYYIKLDNKYIVHPMKYRE